MDKNRIRPRNTWIRYTPYLNGQEKTHIWGYKSSCIPVLTISIYIKRKEGEEKRGQREGNAKEKPVVCFCL